MHRAALLLVVVVSTVLALWSAWSPGFHYLTRAAVFTVAGAIAVYLWARAGDTAYAVPSAFLYVTALLGVAIAAEWFTAPPNQTESVLIWYVPLALLSLLASIVSGLVARLSAGGRSIRSRRPAPPGDR